MAAAAGSWVHQDGSVTDDQRADARMMAQEEIEHREMLARIGAGRDELHETLSGRARQFGRIEQHARSNCRRWRNQTADRAPGWHSR